MRRVSHTDWECSMNSSRSFSYWEHTVITSLNCTTVEAEDRTQWVDSLQGISRGCVSAAAEGQQEKAVSCKADWNAKKIQGENIVLKDWFVNHSEWRADSAVMAAASLMSAQLWGQWWQQQILWDWQSVMNSSRLSAVSWASIMRCWQTYVVTKILMTGVNCWGMIVELLACWCNETETLKSFSS